MIDNKDNEIILCKGIKLDRNYENVLSYNESDMVSLCRNNAIYQADEYNFIEKANNRIVVSHPYSSAMYSNYVAFKNPRFGNKWIFAWVTDVKLINIGSTEITFEVDVWSTWYSRFSVGKAFIEREHVEDDTIGKHTIPEGLETGDYIINETVELGNNELNRKYIAIAYSGNPTDSFPTDTPHQYSGLYTGFRYMILSSPLDADNMIQGFSDEGRLEYIYAIFTIPYGLINNDSYQAEWYNGPGADASHTIEVGDGHYPMFALVPSDRVGSYFERTILNNTTVAMNNTLDEYSPVNNKLFTKDYNYLYVTNNTGTDIQFNYEDFIDNNPIFKITGAISIGNSIKLIPQNYKKFDTEESTNSLYTYGVNASKYPTLGWVGDAYTNWLTQNAVNIATGFIGAGVSTIGGLLTGSFTATAVGVMDITNKMAQLEQHKRVSEVGNGNINAGDLTYSSRKMNFTLYKMSIKKEYAIIIDKYLSRFGYKVNEVKQPNLNSRQEFNFIKVGGMDELISGDIPSTDLEKINKICRKGVTIFHNYTNFGNYTISNPIVS